MALTAGRATVHLVPQSVSKDELRELARRLFGDNARVQRARRYRAGYEASVTIGGRVAVREEGPSPRQALLRLRETLRLLQVRTKDHEGGAR